MHALADVLCVCFCSADHVYFRSTLPALMHMASHPGDLTALPRLSEHFPVLQHACWDTNSDICSELRAHAEAALGIRPEACGKAGRVVRPRTSVPALARVTSSVAAASVHDSALYDSDCVVDRLRTQPESRGRQVCRAAVAHSYAVQPPRRAMVLITRVRPLQLEGTQGRCMPILEV